VLYIESTIDTRDSSFYINKKIQRKHVEKSSREQPDTPVCDNAQKLTLEAMTSRKGVIEGQRN
jgi:hypothetical protein